MWIQRKEICLAVILTIVMIFFSVYFNMGSIAEYHPVGRFLAEEAGSQSYGRTSSRGVPQYSKVITETIKSRLDRGRFEGVIGELEILTGEMDGYVKSLHMTYQDRFWSGTMVCKVPPANVTSFTFNARGIIEENGTVTYINISVENVNMSKADQQGRYSTINFRLEEVKPKDGKNEIVMSITSALPILTTSLMWIAGGLVIGIPLYFTFLGLVVLVNRGIIPLWKNTLKKSAK